MLPTSKLSAPKLPTSTAYSEQPSTSTASTGAASGGQKSPPHKRSFKALEKKFLTCLTTTPLRRIFQKKSLQSSIPAIKIEASSSKTPPTRKASVYDECNLKPIPSDHIIPFIDTDEIKSHFVDTLNPEFSHKIWENLNQKAHTSKLDLLPYDSNRDRFKDILSRKVTSTNALYHIDLNANLILIQGKSFAIASQYPMIHQVKDFLKLITKTSSPLVVVLSSQSEIDNSALELPPYFQKDGQYGNIKLASHKLSQSISLDDKVEAHLHHIFLSKYADLSPRLTKKNQKRISLLLHTFGVIHIHNLQDRQSLTTEALQNLTQFIKIYKNGYGSGLPIVHCRAGVGRTGQLLAVMAMNETPKHSLETIITDLRNSRSPYMVQTEAQFYELQKFEKLIRDRNIRTIKP